MLRQKDDVRQTLGYLPQEFGVYPKVTAEKLLDHFAVLKGIGERRARNEVVEALLRQTNLWDVRKQKLGGYSGGMRQRFGVAVALLGNPRLMIVDEPTAGLDPAERVRFLNLLSELGENSVVLLSTHIVEDVSELCTRMAIIDQGEILLEAEPLSAVDDLHGRIWHRVIAKEELPALEREHAVISTKLLAGRTIAHVYSDAKPGPGFEPSEPDLEDVYFSTMAGHIGRRRDGVAGRLRPPPRKALRRGSLKLLVHPASSEGGKAPADRMKFREIFRFELAYQARRVSTWVYFIILFAFGFLIMRRRLGGRHG